MGDDTEEDAGGRGERIAKWLARAGIASRRDAEKLIAEGAVSLNGKVVEGPATFVGPDDKVLVGGKPVGAPERTRLFRYHKPPGLVTTHKDPEGRRTVFDELPAGLPRLVSVGRLDLNSEGLLLLTNDGALSRKLELPDNAWVRRYRARVHGRVDERALAALAHGVTVEGVAYGPIEAGLDSRQGTNAWLTVALTEGKNREVRRVLQHLGLTVTRLIRTAYGPFTLGPLPRGAVEEVNAKFMRDQLGLDAPPRILRGVERAAEAARLSAAAEARAADKPDAVQRSRPARPPRARNATEKLRRAWGAVAQGPDADQPEGPGRGGARRRGPRKPG
ncbi:rRNA pseudouridine synthase [Pseudoroseomonas oryzae]|uniref:Pseudouridine synthase n=1 Tax=Teichococcus oryzae TaxID=1608942 RepID=A0A5B2TIB1_9PROT|nr:pseudouridine synthase [Pseudoroseomonas oryzae]KAA2213668.1 rRNA pseudouridine synthase [Pseudoroseomonas oryzae]